MSKHVAFIPARKGSKGFKLKNRILFSRTANFLNQIEWLAEVVVSTDDPVIKELASDYGYSVHTRPDMLALDDVSIKDVFIDYLKSTEQKSNVYMWLFYLTVLYRSIDDYLIAPLGKAFFSFNMQFDFDESIRGDLEVKAQGTESLMANEVRSQRLMQFLQVASNPVLAPFAKMDYIIR